MAIDSVFAMLNSKEQQLKMMGSIQFDEIEGKFQSFLAEEQFQKNKAALESVEAALEFLEIVPLEKAAIEKELTTSKKQLNDLKDDVLNNKYSQPQFKAYLAEEKKVAEKIGLRIGYLTDKWNAHLLLSETLQKSIENE